jgi:hypothetical protein
MKKMFVTLMVAFAMVGLGYSGHAQATKAGKAKVDWSTTPLSDSHKVEFKSLPLAVREAAHKHIGNNSHIEDVDKGMLHGRVVYELAYKKEKGSNKTYEVRIGADGAVLGEHGD